MKIKNDFVTNSSSTSFCVWGISRYPDDFNESEYFLPEKLLRKSYNYYLEKKSQNKWCTPMIRSVKDEESVSFEIFCDKIRNIDYDYTDYVVGYLRTLNIDAIFFHEGCEGGGFILGRSPFSMKSDETLKSFKDILKLELVNLGFENPVLVDGINEEINY